MDVGGAFGGGKAGAPFNPILFVQRPQVFLRALCWVRPIYEKKSFFFLVLYSFYKTRKIDSNDFAHAHNFVHQIVVYRILPTL